MPQFDFLAFSIHLLHALLFSLFCYLVIIIFKGYTNITKISNSALSFFACFFLLLLFYGVFIFVYYSLYGVKASMLLENQNIWSYFPHFMLCFVYFLAKKLLVMDYPLQVEILKRYKAPLTKFTHLKEFLSSVTIVLIVSALINFFLVVLYTLADTIETAATLAVCFFCTLFGSVVYLAYGKVFLAYNSQLYTLPSGFRKLFYFYTKVFCLKKKYTCLVFLLTGLTCTRLVTPFLFAFSIFSVVIDNCFTISVFFLLCLITTFVVYMPHYQKVIRRDYDDYAFRLLGWNVINTFLSTGAGRIALAVGTAGSIGVANHYASSYATERAIERADALFAARVRKHEALRAEFPHLVFADIKRQPDVKINFLKDTVGLVVQGEKLTLKPKPKFKPKSKS